MTNPKVGKNPVKDELIKNGKKLFAAQGFKKTSVKEITDITGIATGSFYNYFNSKEELFLTIYFEENNKAKKEINEAIDQAQEPTEVIVNVVHLLIKKMERNPILNEFFNRGQFNKIMKKLSPDMISKNLDYTNNLFFPILEKWQFEGKIRAIKPELFLAVLDSIFYIYSHKDDIGSEFFPEIIDFFVMSIAESLKA